MTRWNVFFVICLLLICGMVRAQGKLSGTAAAPPKFVDLTREGTADWTHWGHGDGGSFAYKATGKAQISNFTPLGDFHPAPYKDNAVAFSWADNGAPGEMARTTTGVYSDSFTPGVGFGFHAPADTRLRTLKVYAGGAFAAGTFIAHLSDGSAPDYVNTEISAPHNFYVVFTLVYRAAKDGQTLNVAWINTRSLGPLSNVTLQAATLSENASNAHFVPAALRDAFVTSLASGRDGCVWAGTEGGGAWRYDPSLPAAKAWRQFTTADGLGDNDVYAVACDKQNRVWVGHRNHGVSVFNGEKWKNYDRVTGPLGERIFRIAVCPKEGDVWIASSLGMARYSVHKKTWSYVTRADGLPSDQINAIAFNKAGDIFLGTQCDGIARGYAEEDYINWNVTPGPQHLPLTPSGEGLPSGLINDLLIARDGKIYAATSDGLAISADGGTRWTFRRGRNWIDRVKGLAHPPVPLPLDKATGLLAEDYVTCLAEDKTGAIWLGYRQKGCAPLPPADAKRLPQNDSGRGDEGDFVTAILPQPDAPLWVGRYQFGSLLAEPMAKTAARPVLEAASFPLPAAPPTAAELTEALQKVTALTEPLPAESGRYLGEDWTTQGDWPGRYGRGVGILCAIKSPADDTFVNQADYEAGIEGEIGPHHEPKDSIRRWIQWLQSDNPSVLYDPTLGCRRQSDWDDHGEAYSRAYEGPDLWLTVTVPEGTHRISVYIFNRTGHGEFFNPDRFRDYTVELRTYRPTPEEAETLPALARTRAQNTWGGVYKQFVTQGAGKFYIKICRQQSINTICSGVFVDSLPADIKEKDQIAWMEDVHYNPPIVKPEVAHNGAAPEQPALQLWAALNAAASQKSFAERLAPYRLLAYRSILAKNGDSARLANWRWQLSLWTEEDRKQFSTVITQAWTALTTRFPILKNPPGKTTR